MLVTKVGISSTSMMMGAMATPGLEGLVGATTVGSEKPPAFVGSPYSASSGSFLLFR
jgi:heme A synthase